MSVQIYFKQFTVGEESETYKARHGFQAEVVLQVSGGPGYRFNIDHVLFDEELKLLDDLMEIIRARLKRQFLEAAGN